MSETKHNRNGPGLGISKRFTGTFAEYFANFDFWIDTDGNGHTRRKPNRYAVAAQSFADANPVDDPDDPTVDPVTGTFPDS